MDSHEIYDQVRAHYSTASQNNSAEYGSAIAKSFGYSEEELASIPTGSNLGLSCGNPLAIASIREGETVIDLGSGAGFDAFLASSRVGASGKVIGVDMNKDMLAKANKIKSETDKVNVTFVESRITDMAVLESGIANCIISNCVINLVPAAEKHLVFNEMFRLLKPGGRLAISDVLAKKPLPETLRSDIAMYVGCISGASEVHEYEQFLQDAGFREIVIADTKSDLNVYIQTNKDGSKKADCCIPSEVGKSTSNRAMDCCVPNRSYESLTGTDLNEWIGSFKVYAVRT
ncbi:S-adenosyl-L-methionine-dependent methyltransferase [Ilyonectria destructans]|nr:S-adenosyl-L-methionine-dependent methyltransferase [Ilyonectria destructans]